MQKAKIIQYKNKAVHYRVFGNGSSLVLIHGFGEDGNIWNECIKDLQKDFKIIVPDLPGSGSSEMLDGKILIDDYAAVIKYILDEEKINLCSMIGHSMGGYITLAFAEKYPDALKGFGLFHSTAFADDEEKKRTRYKAIDFIKEKGSLPFLKTSVPNLFADKTHWKEMEALIEEGKKISPQALIQYYHAMINRPDRTEILKCFKKPVLFIIGEKDNAIALQASLQQCYLPAISHIHILDTGHMGMIEESSKCKSIVKSFLQNI